VVGREYETLLTQFSKELEKLQLRHQVSFLSPSCVESLNMTAT
jgi:hypothetical protein